MSATKSEGVVNYARIMALRIDRAVTEKADQIAESAQKIVTEAFKQPGKRLEGAQLNGLAATAVTTEKVSDVENFVKKRVPRIPAWAVVESDFLKTLQGLRETAEELGANLKPELKALGVPEAMLRELIDDRGKSPRLHLRLVQEWVTAFTVSYQYQAWKEDPKTSPPGGQTS